MNPLGAASRARRFAPPRRRLIPLPAALPLAVLLFHSGTGCQDLWGAALVENPNNCMTSIGRCRLDQVCNPITELCEPALALDSISPQSGPSSGGLSLSLTGRGFTPGTTVFLGQTSVSAEPVVVDSDGQLMATLPTLSGACGAVPVQVTRPGGISVRRDGLFSYYMRNIGFATSQPLGTSDSTSTVYVVAHDLNNDGLLDLVATAFNSQGIDVQLGVGGGKMKTLPRIPTGAGPYHIAVADVDGNGWPDLAVANVYGNTVSVILAAGSGQFQSPVSLSNSGPLTVHFMDADSNGTIDLIVLTNTSKARLWKGDGLGGFTFESEVTLDASTSTLATSADVDLDGHPELITPANSAAAVAVYHNHGDGTFALASMNPLTTAATSVVVADVNNDGKPDLIAAEYQAGLVSVMLGHGDGTFDPKVGYGTIPGSRVVAAGDLNCDGAVDLAVGHLGNPQAVVLHGRGDGSFEVLTSTASLVNATSNLALAIGDLDGDMRPDLILGGDGTTAALQFARNASQ